MDIKALYDKIHEQAFNLRRGLSNSVNHAAFITQTKNVLYNNLDAIEEALKFAEDAERQIKILEIELNDAERELDEKDQQIKELTAEKTTPKKKKAAGAADE